MTLHVTQEEFPQLWADWEVLLSHTPLPTVFQTPLWHSTWWQEMAGQAELRLTTVRDNGALVGIAPLMCQDSTVTFLGDTDLWDYHDFVVAPNRNEEFYPALFESLEQQPWTHLKFSSLPQDSSVLAYLPNIAKVRGYIPNVIKEDVSPGVVLPSTWDEYLMILSKKNRHELRRKLRKLETQAVYQWYGLDGDSSLDKGLTDFFHLMRHSRQDKAVFLTPDRELFFRHMAEEMANADVLKLYFMEIEGERVAGAMCFDYRQTRFLYNSGYDPEYSSLSVGLLLKALCLQQAIKEGKRYFDFLRGDEPYKYDLGAKDVTLYQLAIQR